MFAAISSSANVHTAIRLPDWSGVRGGDAKKDDTTATPSSTTAAGGSTQNLSEDQLKQLESLRKRDREVRAHEAAHQAAAGGLARGGASFSYQRGPDGQQYAIGGEVNIDTSPVSGNPAATLAKAATIARAALAPAEPSGQDRQVAARAGQMAAQALAELTLQHANPSDSGKEKTGLFKTVEAADRDRPTAIDLYA
ncbi:SprA-related family protein [Methylomagnum ishizawai]|uniref:SprA-related family protein n=1 Tax=Methylomagnum ishizawai TaxID=1760988 RepID=A0A1Y6CYZ7_9GAMM|nr:putative metalloprotease CJM1_0395 family protein [Methylomagnum ishizawai]SMF95450.1 SprA-related family protein [Methylomagnum ishizawai]